MGLGHLTGQDGGKRNGYLQVVSIEPLGVELPLYDITTGTGDFIANGVVSHNCFARPTHTYLGFDAGRDFEREIVVKVNVAGGAARRAGRPSWKGEHVALGTNTDPYQWVEGRYKLMPGIWEALRDFSNPCSVLTKSPLLLRDLRLLQRDRRAWRRFTANLSVPTLDEKAWRATEPHTPNPRARLEAVAELNRAGIPTGVLIAPLMPGINDSPEQVERILDLGDGGRRHAHRRHRAAPARRGARGLLRLAALPAPRPGPALRAALQPRGVRPAGRARATAGSRRPTRPPVLARRICATRWPVPPRSGLRGTSVRPSPGRRRCSERAVVSRAKPEAMFDGSPVR